MNLIETVSNGAGKCDSGGMIECNLRYAYVECCLIYDTTFETYECSGLPCCSVMTSQRLSAYILVYCLVCLDIPSNISS